LVLCVASPHELSTCSAAAEREGFWGCPLSRNPRLIPTLCLYTLLPNRRLRLRGLPQSCTHTRRNRLNSSGGVGRVIVAPRIPCSRGRHVVLA
jgi:hypothetical protein